MKINIKRPSASFSSRVLIASLALVIAIWAPIQTINQPVYADQYDDKIKALREEVATYNAQAEALQSQAQTLQTALTRISNEKYIIQAQIDISQTKYDQLVAKIAETEQKIKDNQDALGLTLANLYVENKTTPVEMLFGSKNISEYMNKQEYRNSVRDELTANISTIKDLKTQLETEKTDAGRVLEDQKSQRNALAAKESEQQNLLSETNGQEAAYQQLSSDKSIEITKLRAQQAAELAARAKAYGGRYTSLPGDGSKGGYPSAWAYAPMNAYVDDWGMYSRQCVSYVAFKVQQAYGNMPYWGGRGNANQWPGNAKAAGIKTSSVPAAGAVGVISTGTYGHVAWVESVNADGTINISHYNIGWNGDYAEWYNLNASYFDTYIYFGG